MIAIVSEPMNIILLTGLKYMCSSSIVGTNGIWTFPLQSCQTRIRCSDKTLSGCNDKECH